MRIGLIVVLLVAGIAAILLAMDHFGERELGPEAGMIRFADAQASTSSPVLVGPPVGKYLFIEQVSFVMVHSQSTIFRDSRPYVLHADGKLEGSTMIIGKPPWSPRDGDVGIVGRLSLAGGNASGTPYGELEPVTSLPFTAEGFEIVGLHSDGTVVIKVGAATRIAAPGSEIWIGVIDGKRVSVRNHGFLDKKLRSLK